uniref:Uncharacterized protein n=1 Tax=Arundo donax TaxID=35708 RepID=A0A0A8Z335_ARUDO
MLKKKNMFGKMYRCIKKLAHGFRKPFCNNVVCRLKVALIL